MNRLYRLITLGLGMGALSLSAQSPIAPVPPAGRPPKQIDDTLLVTYALSPERSVRDVDTMPDRDFRMYDPARRQEIDWGTLGNLGAAGRPLLFENQAQMGYNIGVSAFDLYRIRPEQLGFYRNRRTFSEAYFSQGRNQFETNLNARFSRTFEHNVNFSLDYRTLNNLGQYRYQRDRHNGLAMGLWFPVGERYEAFAIYVRNVIRQQDNGGIVSDSIFGTGEFSGPIAAEVRLPNEVAFSRIDDQYFHYSQHFRLLGKTQGRVLRASHTAEWHEEKYKFADQGNVTAGLGADGDFFYPYFLTDLRGLRHFIDAKRLDNTFSLNTFKEKSGGRPSDLLSAGIKYSYLKIDQDARTFQVNNLFLTGQLAITPSEKFAFTANGALGLLENLGEYQLQGDLKIGLGKAGKFHATLLSQIRPPGLISKRLYVSERQVWDNDFKKPVENTLTATYALPSVGLELSGRAHAVSNYLYFDQNALAAQTTAPLQVTQLVVTENIKWGALHLENTFALQQANRSDVIHLPKWFSKNSLSYYGLVFKKRMMLNAGADFRINSDFQPDAYFPLSWQFRLQNELTQKPFPWVDLFLSFKVQAFRGFLKYENFVTLWDKSQVYYQTAWHGQPFGALRFGIAWRFMDDNKQKSNSQAPPGSGSATTLPPIGTTGRGN